MVNFNVNFTYAGYAIFGSGVGKNPAVARSAGTEQNKVKKEMTRNLTLPLRVEFTISHFSFLSPCER